jgi:hypothetical protein
VTARKQPNQEDAMKLNPKNTIVLAAKLLTDTLVDAGHEGMLESALFVAFQAQGMSAGAWTQIVDALMSIGRVRRSLGRLYISNEVGNFAQAVQS